MENLFDLKSLKLSMAFGLLMKTMPLLLIRLGASLAFWFVALVYLGITGGVAFLIGSAVPILGFILFIVALVGVAPLYQLAYRYVFFMIKAAHIAVLAELLTKDSLPSGEGQLAWGKKRVEERFGEVNAMFVVDEVVQSVVRAFTNTVYRITYWLPASDTLQNLANVLNRIIKRSMNYIDEAIMARSFYDDDTNVWENARDGIALYAMVWKPMLTNAIALMIISYVPFIVVFIVFIAPVGGLVALIFSARAAGWAIIATLLLAWMVKVAIGDSFAMAAMIAAYQRETEGMVPNEEITSRLEGLSDKFREMTERAGSEFDRFTRQDEKPKNEPTDDPVDDPPGELTPGTDAT